MPSKLLIVINSLGSQGEEVAAALAVAQAASEQGLYPVVATHIACPTDLIPDGLAFLPIFGDDSSSPPPALFALRGDVQALAGTSAEAVRGGAQSVQDLLHAYFDFPSSAEPAPTPPADFKHRIERLLPPVLWHILRWAYPGRWRAWLRPLALCCVPPVLRPVLRSWYRALRPVPLPAAPASKEPAPEGLDTLSQALSAIGCGDELERCRRFQRDLERLLCLVAATAGDHVLLTSTHSRELIAVQQIVGRLSRERAPLFHARFHHSVAAPRLPYHRCPTPQEQADFQLRKIQQLHLDWFARNGNCADVRLYASQRQLAEELECLTGLPVQALPFKERCAAGQPGSDSASATRLVAALLGSQRMRTAA